MTKKELIDAMAGYPDDTRIGIRANAGTTDWVQGVCNVTPAKVKNGAGVEHYACKAGEDLLVIDATLECLTPEEDGIEFF